MANHRSHALMQLECFREIAIVTIPSASPISAVGPSTARLSLLDITLHDTALRSQKWPKTGGLAAGFRKGSIWDSPASALVLSALKFPLIPHKRTRPSR